MNIQNNYKSPQFTSRLNPIPPSIIKTKYGDLTLQEITKSEMKSKNFLEELAKFFCKNFASNTNDPSWLEYNNVSKHVKNLREKSISNYFKSIFKHDDGNMTLLLAKDNHNKIQGACLSLGYNLVEGIEKCTLYLDSIAVNREFRGFNIGKTMMQKTISANSKASSKFTDIFLVGEKKARKFYDKLGFSSLDNNDKDQQKVAKVIQLDRQDYPDYVDFLNLPLKKDEPRWYSKAAKIIKDEWF